MFNLFLHHYLVIMISFINCLNTIPLFTHKLFRFRSRFIFFFFFFFFFLKSISNCSTFLSFKGTTYAYLLKISITHNKKLILILSLLINCIYARSPKNESINDECTFRFSNFLIIGLCNYSANCGVAKYNRRWFSIILF